MLPLWIVLAILPILGGAERFNCKGRILGAYYADAKSGCKAFHVCVRVAGGGVRDFRFFCPPGTLFHQEAQTCTDWGDDDPLACPADLYDGQFDLYKIGSGYDTKKLSSQGARDEEAEFGLQRAETGDRRLSQSNANSVSGGPASDLRAAHSSDFFSGQRERGRDDFAPALAPAPAPAPSARPQAPPRQSFRRPTSPRNTPFTTPLTSPAPQPSNSPQYEHKRKLVRKRPIYVSTQAPTTFQQNTPQQSFPPKQNPKQFSQKSQQPFVKPQESFPQKQQQQIPPKQQPVPQPPQQSFAQPPFVQKPQPSDFPKFDNNGAPQFKQPLPTLPPPADLPAQYKDEYVEVPRVAPKKRKNRYFPNNPTPVPFSQSSPAQNFNKKEGRKEGLVELYNYDAQSTPGFNNNDQRSYKVRNNFSVQDVPREDFARTHARNAPTTADYNTASTRGFSSSTPAYKNINSVSYEPESKLKNNFAQYSGKQNFFNGPTNSPTSTFATPANLNTIAYNTNIALNTIQPANYVSSDEDDGQYRPPEGEDDGQYRPELYERERELLSGAHSLNIAASGNRLPEDQKQHGKSQVPQRPVAQTAPPRPFRPAPTSTLPPTTTRAPEPTYTTTNRAPTTYNTQRTFDYFQTYTTTVRLSDAPVQINFAAAVSNARPTTTQAPRPTTTHAPRPTTTQAPRTAEPKQSRPPAPPTLAPARPHPHPHHKPKPNPPKKEEDSSYDYAYYDSDPGFTEYDHIEEFGRTKTRA